MIIPLHMAGNWTWTADPMTFPYTTPEEIIQTYRYRGSHVAHGGGERYFHCFTTAEYDTFSFQGSYIAMALAWEYTRTTNKGGAVWFCRVHFNKETPWQQMYDTWIKKALVLTAFPDADLSDLIRD